MRMRSRKPRVVRRDEAAVADAEEVLGRIEAERRRDARARDVRRAERLRRVLDHRHAELVQLARAGAGRPKRCTARIAFVRGVIRAATSSGSRFIVDGVDVGEDRRRAATRDRLRRRVERERGADHLVARADPERVEHEHDRVGAVGDADRIVDAEIVGRLPLERGDVGPENELAARRARRRSPRGSEGETARTEPLRQREGSVARLESVEDRLSPVRSNTPRAQRSRHNRVVDEAEIAVEVLVAASRGRSRPLPGRRPRPRSRSG